MTRPAQGPNWALWALPGERTLWERAAPAPDRRRAGLWLGYWAAVFAGGLGVATLGPGTGWALGDLMVWGVALYAPVGAGLTLWAAATRRAFLLTEARALAAEGRFGRWRVVVAAPLLAGTEVAREGARVRIGGLSGVALEAADAAEAARVAGLAEGAVARRRAAAAGGAAGEGDGTGAPSGGEGVGAPSGRGAGAA